MNSHWPGDGAAAADGPTACCAPAAHLSSRLATDGCTATTPGTGQLAPRAWPSCRASRRRCGGPPCLVYSGPPQPLLLDTDEGWLSTWGRSKGRATGGNASVRGRGRPLWSSGPRAPGCVGFGYSDWRTALNARIGGGEAAGLAPRRNCTGSYSAAAVATTWPSTATLPEAPVGLRRRQGPPLPGMVCAAPATASGCWRLASLWRHSSSCACRRPGGGVHRLGPPHCSVRGARRPRRAAAVLAAGFGGKWASAAVGAGDGGLRSRGQRGVRLVRQLRPRCTWRQCERLIVHDSPAPLPCLALQFSL